MSDSSEEAQQELAALEAKYADDLTRSEAQFVEVAESMSGRVWFTPPPHHDSATRKGSAHQGETHSRTFASGGVGKRVNRDGPRDRCHRSDVEPRIGPESWVHRKSSLVCPGVFVCHQRQPRGGLPDRLGQRHLRSGRRDGGPTNKLRASVENSMPLRNRTPSTIGSRLCVARSSAHTFPGVAR